MQIPVSIKRKVERLIICDRYDNDFKDCVASGYVYNKERIVSDIKVPKKYKSCGKLSCYRCKHFWIHRKEKTWYKESDFKFNEVHDTINE